jgi:hypothetical protein
MIFLWNLPCLALKTPIDGKVCAVDSTNLVAPLIVAGFVITLTYAWNVLGLVVDA